MMSIPDDLAVHDIGQWLNGGWYLFKRNDDSAPEPAKLGTRRDEYCNIDLEGEAHDLVNDMTFPFWPPCGAINMKGFAIYVERRQVRQYRRTYNEQCLIITVPRKWDVMKKMGTSAPNLCPNSPEVVREVFSPCYYTYTMALQMMESGHSTSVALNRHLIVAGPLVYYRNVLVAKMDGQRIVPMGCEDSRIRRIIKFFDGRVTL